jgi:ketosteroid isomerase-like protein
VLLAVELEVCEGDVVSAENVELVRRLQPGPGVDIAAMFRDERAADSLLEGLAPLVHPDVEVGGDIGTERIAMTSADRGAPYAGLERLRAAWLQWLAPWATYRTEVEDVVDAGDRVVVLVRDFARVDPDAPEVSQKGASLWTVRDGKVARAEFYADRAEGLRAAGLAD